MKKTKIPRLAVKPAFAHRLLYPQLLTVLSAKSGIKTVAMPLADVIIVSENPAKIAVSIKAGLQTNQVMKNAKRFSLNWLDYRKRFFVERLLSSNKSNHLGDVLKSNNIPYNLIFDAPVLEDSVAYLICENEKVLTIGDHKLYFGKVMGAMAHLDFDEHWKFNEYRPIFYLGSSSSRKSAFRTL